MAILQKRYINHFGLDLKSSDLTRPPEFSSGMKNMQYKESGSIEKRKGFQYICGSAGGYGLFEYPFYNVLTSAQDPKLLTVDQNLYVAAKTLLNISYSGLSLTAYLSLFYDTTTSQYRCQILEGINLVLDFALGLGIDEASPVTITNLSTAINALTGFTASISGSGSVPAAFLRVTRDYNLVTAPLALDAYSWSQVNSTVTNPLATYYSHRNDANFENVSAIHINNVMYFGSGWNETMKYDGQTFYRAGLPTPVTASAAIGSAGAITGSNYGYKIQYIQNDNAGNIVEGNLSDLSNLLNLTGANANKNINVTVPQIQAGSGFNTNCAIVNGNQAATNTITVDLGHTIKVGDSAYFKVSGGTYETRTVTGIGSTSITISGAAVSVDDNAVISNNLKIGIYRNQTSGTTPNIFYLVEEIANNSFASTVSFVDNLPDASLGALLIPPATDRSAPPKGKYVTQWNGIMVVGGNIENPNTIYYSDIDGPEYFPADSNFVDCQTPEGDIITGLASNNEVFAVGKTNSFGVSSGNIQEGQIRFDVKARNVGINAHNALKEVNGILFWLANQGPRNSSGGEVPKPLGPANDQGPQSQVASRIDPIFDDSGLVPEQVLQKKRAVAINHQKGSRYILFIPAETTTGGEKWANTNSRIFVYDYTRDAWLEWSNLNMASGLAEFNGELYFQERKYSQFHNAVKFNVGRFFNNSDAFDYADHNRPVGGDTDYAQYATGWEALGEPAVLKQFQQLRIYSLESLPFNNFSLRIQEELNYQSGYTRADFTFNFPGAGYGQSQYGIDSYGDPNDSGANTQLIRDRARSMRLIFSNGTIHENIILTGWEIDAEAPYRPELKT